MLLPALLVLASTPAFAVPTIELEERGPGKLPAEGINLVDCEAAERWLFKYTCAACGQVAVWVGDNCETAENRSGAAPTCAEIVPAHAPIPTDSFEIFAPEVVSPLDPTCPPADTTTSVFVLDLLDASDDASSAIEYPILVDTDPPPAPTEVEAEGGEGNVTVSWTADAGEAADRDGFQVLCFPEPSDDAPEPPDGTDTDGGCGYGALAADAPSSTDLFCGGRQGASARSVRIGNLSNGVPYEVAVIAYDNFENPSRLSNVACDEPQPVEDFYEAYRRAGGKAGGGLCTAAPGAPSRPATLFALLACAAALWRRGR